MNDEFPANHANYMDGLIKKHWMKNHVVDTTVETPEEVSLFVCTTLYLLDRFYEFLTMGWQIFHRIMNCMEILEQDRTKYLAQIGHGWKPQFGLNLHKKTLQQMQELLNHSPSWKLIIADINASIIPVHTSFIHLFTPPSVPALDRVQNSAPATSSFSPSTSLHNAARQQALPGSSLVINAGPTISIDKEGPSPIPDHVSAHDSLAMKSEMLGLSSASPSDLSANDFDPQLSVAGFELINNQTPPRHLVPAPQSLACIDPELLRISYTGTTVDPRLLMLNNDNGPSVVPTALTVPPLQTGPITGQAATLPPSDSEPIQRPSSPILWSPSIQMHRSPLDPVSEISDIESEQVHGQQKQNQRMDKGKEKEQIYNLENQSASSDISDIESEQAHGQKKQNHRMDKGKGKEQIFDLRNRSEKSSADEEEEDELDSGNNDDFVPPKPSRAALPRNRRGNVIGRLPRKPRKSNQQVVESEVEGPESEDSDIGQGEKNRVPDQASGSDEDVNTGHQPHNTTPDQPVTPPRSPSPAVTPPHQPESSSTPLEQQIAIGLQLEAASIIKSGSLTMSGLASSEGCQILAAFLALSPDERKSALDISHDDLVAFFKKLAGSNKKSLKRSNVKYVLSPKRKRIRKYT